MKAAPPLRFLGLVLGGWVCLRAAILVPLPFEDTAEHALPVPLAKAEPTAEALPPAPLPLKEAAAQALPPTIPETGVPLLIANRQVANVPLLAPTPAVEAGLPPSDLPQLMATGDGGNTSIPFVGAATASSPRADRWSASAWAFLRGGDAPQLAAGGVLGGSQVGGRLLYRFSERLAVSGRAYAPLRGDGAEAALGLEWQPFRQIPVRILAERRQAIGDEGRSAFSVLAYGGVSEKRVAGRLRLDAYAQAGVVGLRSRDLFVDGEARLDVPLSSTLSAGAGLWGAAQPGDERLDLGPQLTLRLPLERATLRVSADWRIHVAGDARPGTGPALTLATDF